MATSGSVESSLIPKPQQYFREAHAHLIATVNDHRLKRLVELYPDRDRWAEINGKMDLWTMNPDGSNQIDLSNNPATENTPAWSPDGTKIVFASDRDGNWEIYIKPLLGREITPPIIQAFFL